MICISRHCNYSNVTSREDKSALYRIGNPLLNSVPIPWRLNWIRQQIQSTIGRFWWVVLRFESRLPLSDSYVITSNCGSTSHSVQNKCSLSAGMQLMIPILFILLLWNTFFLAQWNGTARWLHRFYWLLLPLGLLDYMVLECTSSVKILSTETESFNLLK